MKRKLFSIGLVCLIALFFVPHFVHAQEKINGPWLWMIAPTVPGQGGAASINIDSLAVASSGAVTEADVAANGANEGDRVGNYMWTLGRISATGGDNINECLNRIGLTDGPVDDHSSYALFTFKSDIDRNNVMMHVGSDDAIKVWVNGKVVHNNPIDRGSFGFQDVFAIDLVAGDNLLMVKVSERGGGWSMFVGIDSEHVQGPDIGLPVPQEDRPIVRLIYFLPKDIEPHQEIDADMDKVVKMTQKFFADEMERHGFGRKTFFFEADTNGKAVVYHINGQYNTSYYKGSEFIRIRKEVEEWFQLRSQDFPFIIPGINQYRNNIYLTVAAAGAAKHFGSNKYLCESPGTATLGSGLGGFALVCVPNDMNIAAGYRIHAHELGHVFGLRHDFRSYADYIMGSVTPNTNSLSKCASIWLDVHRAFNLNGSQEQTQFPQFKMLPLSLAAPPNAIRLRFEITSPDRIHQVQLLTPEGDGYGSLLGCKELNGKSNRIVEFITTDLTLKTRFVSLQTIDVHGNITWSERFPIDITLTLPPSHMVSIPDVNLTAAARQTLRLSSNQVLTSHTMLDLRRLDAPNRKIIDLIGLEYALNLKSLHLGAEYVDGQGWVNSNKISNLQPIASLLKLNFLNFSYNSISDISPVVGMTQMERLYLNNNSISDISALEGMAQLSGLELSNNNISDVSALSELAVLTLLMLDSNNISDISVLSELTQLEILRLNNNNVSDVSVLSELTQLNYLGLGENSISDISALKDMTQLRDLSLQNNNISDVSSLKDITQLVYLFLGSNNISDVSPLQGMTQLKYLSLWDNPLSYTAINNHIPTMKSKGVEIGYEQRVPTKLLKISGDAQQVITNTELPIPFVVEVQDQWNRVFSEVPVTFTITKGSGKMSASNTATDAKGRAKARFTLGQTEGETIINVTAAKILQPIRFTVTASLPNSPVHLSDTNLSTKIAETLGKPSDEPVTVGDMLTLTSLTAENAGISDLTGLQHASNLTTLVLDNNNIIDVQPLIVFKKLETLSLENNKVSEIAPLVELTELKTLRLRGNLLSYPSLYTTIPAMRAHGVVVTFDPRIPTTLIHIPGTSGVAGATVQAVVQVQDQRGVAFSGVPVTFTLTATGGHLSKSQAVSNLNGKAITTLTLGPKPGEGENTVSVTVTEIPQQLNFTINTINPNTLVDVPDVNLRAKIVETLNKPKNAKLNATDMLRLTTLEARNANIRDLTGIEYAHNLRYLNLGAAYIEGKGAVNSNAVSDLSPLMGLTNLNWLVLDGSNISDVSALSGLTQLTLLGLNSNNISDVSALSELTQLKILRLNNNNISDMSALSELTQLTELNLSDNDISDISTLSALINLNTLWLHNNNISDMSPLLALNLTGTEWDSTGLYLWNNPLSYTSINTHIPTMQAKGIEVQYHQRTPTKLLKISGDAQQAITNSELPLPFVVEVQDQWNRVFSEVPVTFTITKGSGKLSTTNTTTDAKGRAKTRFTIGETGGQTTIRVTAVKISQPVQFTVTAILLNSPVSLPDANLKVKIAETLGKPINEPITVGDMLTLTSLTAKNAGISNLTGLQHAANLTTLVLDNNNITDVQPLTVFKELETVSLENNKISEVAPILELTELKTLRLRGNPLSYPSLNTHIPAMRARGVAVTVDPRTPTTLIYTPGTTGVAGATVEVVVQVQDQEGIAFSGVPVTFTLAAAGGHLSKAQAVSNPNGKATTTLTLGPKPGENTVSATVTELSQPLKFTITTTDPNAPVHIPDVNLRAKIAETLNKPKNAKLNATDMLKLTTLDAGNANIQNLTGIEYAHNLIWLILGIEYIEGKGIVNSNAVSDLSPLTGLTKLDWLVLDDNNISDVSALAKLIQLTSLGLNGNNISDVSALTELTQLTSLRLHSNNISDVSALSKLTQLKYLSLGNNNISDVSPLQGMTQLEELSLGNNNISDITSLASMTQLESLYLWQNNISDIFPIIKLNITTLSIEWNPLGYVSINTHIPSMQAKGIGVKYQQRMPTKLLKISGDAQQAITNSKLPLPFVVEVQDEWNRVFSEVPVTFTITKGSGELSTTHTTTDAKGRAKVRFTIGQIAEKTTISVTAAKIAQPVQFTVTAIPLNFPVSLPDANLKAKIAETLDKPGDEPVTVGDMLNLTSLTAKNAGISDVTGLQHASNLTTLVLDNNNITDVQSLTVFKKLETLSLKNNKISEIVPLVGLTELQTLRLRGNPLSYPSLNTHIPAMRARGVDVTVDPRTPTTLVYIPGTPGVAGAALQVIVQVQDQKGIAFSGVPVTFTLTAAGGHLSTSEAVSNPNGKAITTLTLGPKPGENTVKATVSEISQPFNFTITTIDANTPVHIPDVNLHAKIAETLNKPKNAKLNAADMLKLTTLDAQNDNIQDITGIEYAYNLADLYLRHNNISDVSPLTSLTKLRNLYLRHNNISDVSPFADMTQLEILYLIGNSISDVSPLIGITQLKTLGLEDNPLSYTSINTHIPAMQAKGIDVVYDNVAHPALYIVSGNEQEDFAGSVLSSPLVVEAQDENGEPMAGVSVTFTVETGNGQLTAPTATTDADGRAQTHLMLGWTPGRNTVRASGEGIESWAIFSAIGIKQTIQITEDVNRDGVVDVEDLVLVAATLGTTPPKDAIPQTDVNADGVVNREDMELVLAALEAAPAAPTSVWTAANLQRWIDEAKQRTNRDEIFLQGIAVLEQLLASMLPKKTALLANYPNPFNPETWIPYHLAKPAEVTLRIYAVNGVLVRTLVLGHQAAGIYLNRSRAAYWDGRNAQGESVASGVYFYTLTAGDFSATRKMLIMK